MIREASAEPVRPVEERLRTLLMHALAGDVAAYRAFLQDLTGHLRAFLRRRLRHLEHDVEDVVQEILLAVHNGRHTYRPDEPLTVWVNAIARYKLADHLRARSRREALQEPLDDDDELFAVSDTQPALARRDVEQCLHILSNCVTAWRNRAKIELVVILPLILAQQRRITHSFSGSFKPELDNQLGTKNWGNVRVEFRSYRSRERSQGYDGWQVFDQLVSTASASNLLDLPETDASTTPLVRWAVDVFRSEVQLRFSGGINVHGRLYSVMLDYPKLVRSAGRLTPAH